jgi:spore cortex formation protein SpoVR/YcgB (stage V sporulation)
MATIDSMNKDTIRLSDGPDWTFDLLDVYLAEIDRVAKLYRLDTYPHQIEVITSEQMMDAYSSVGMPINYPHWSFGKKFIETERLYKHGQQGLAYEIVINSNPCIAYLMEENTITMQALVMAHACYGHNSFFKNNYLFRSWTDASSIVDYLIFARKYITDCEERYGVEEVEKLLDSCHALMNYGVDRYKRPQKSRCRRRKPARKAVKSTCKARSTHCGAPCQNVKKRKPLWKRAAILLSRRKTCSILWKKTPRCWSPGSVKFCASCVKSASIFTRRNRLRS